LIIEAMNLAGRKTERSACAKPRRFRRRRRCATDRKTLCVYSFEQPHRLKEIESVRLVEQLSG
jgi:hypothetical protein